MLKHPDSVFSWVPRFHLVYRQGCSVVCICVRREQWCVSYLSRYERLVSSEPVGTTLLSIVVGHFLSVFAHTLGDIASVSASGAIQIPTATVIDADGKPTGETVQKTAHDQVALSGVLQSADDAHTPGAFFNLHCRAALPLSGPHGQGRTALKWIIDGEHGTLEVQNRPEDGAWGAFPNLTEKRVLLNGEEVRWEATEADRLGPSGKAWLEFAKGEDGVYYDLEKSVKVHRVLDAALTSIRDGKRVSLV